MTKAIMRLLFAMLLFAALAPAQQEQEQEFIGQVAAVDSASGVVTLCCLQGVNEQAFTLVIK